MKVRQSVRRTALALPVVAMIAVVVLIAVHWTERARNASEEYAVYSAYLSQGISEDAHDWSVDAHMLFESLARIVSD